MVTPHAGLPTMWLAKSEWLPLSLLVMALLLAAVVVHSDDAGSSRPRHPTIEEARREALKALSPPTARPSLRLRRTRATDPVFAVR